MLQQRGKKKRDKARKDEAIPHGRPFTPAVSLTTLKAAMTGAEGDAETLTPHATAQRKQGKDIRKMARDRGKPYQDVWNHPHRMREGWNARKTGRAAEAKARSVPAFEGPCRNGWTTPDTP